MLTNNDVIRRIRYIFDFNDTKVIELFALGGQTVTRAEISNWLKKDEDEEFVKIKDEELSVFLNGLIIDKRGKKDDKIPTAEKRLNNNIVFRKLRIALNLKDDDILEILALTGMKVSKTELSAFFRNPKQSQYRPCNDQLLRNFLKGLQLKYNR
ncbi:MAG: DUF1456 family protein [Bacteroidales bacterium]|nr:DUF1456 family protein [Bacteroidales bacterium]HPD95571.1 DUF1456 family protein [Tenuifilaceae bacterium]